LSFPSLTAAQREQAAELADGAVRVAQEGGDVEAWLRGWASSFAPPDQEQSLDSGD
jgi:hypothetical protein